MLRDYLAFRKAGKELKQLANLRSERDEAELSALIWAKKLEFRERDLKALCEEILARDKQQNDTAREV